MVRAIMSICLMWALLLKFYDRIYYGKIYFSLQHTVIIIYNPAIAIYTLHLDRRRKVILSKVFFSKILTKSRDYKVKGQGCQYG